MHPPTPYTMPGNRMELLRRLADDCEVEEAPTSRTMPSWV